MTIFENSKNMELVDEDIRKMKFPLLSVRQYCQNKDCTDINFECLLQISLAQKTDCGFKWRDGMHWKYEQRKGFCTKANLPFSLIRSLS